MMTKNSLKTWKDLTFWKTEIWGDIKTYLENNPHYPEKKDVFRSLALTRFEDIKTVIIGQDPYHTEGLANGLAFSVRHHHRGSLPPSLRNIYQELRDDLHKGQVVPSNFWPATGDLSRWARQGVLLINTLWTVAPGEPLSHEGIGWEDLTEEILQMINEHHKSIPIVLWGKKAHDLYRNVGMKNPKVVSSHPSPLSAKDSFFGSRPFTRVNALLKVIGQEHIDWR